MTEINYAQLLQLAMPEVIVVVAALIVMAIDLLVLRKRSTQLRFAVAATLASLGCAGAILRIVLAPVQANILDGTLIANPLTHLVQITLLVLTIFTLFISVDSKFTEHIGEFVLLILVATAGMMFLVGSQDLLVIFISLELLSLSLYVLAAFSKRSLQSWEAALKYFLFGGMSAAFLLFGFSLLYGLSNSTSLTHIAAAIHGPALNPLLVIAIVTTAIGLGFKIAAAPFHFWAPDVYQGAPAPSAAFIASGSKVASFFIFFQVMALGFAGAEGTASLPHIVRGWVPVLALMATLSMLLGNLAAIRQHSTEPSRAPLLRRHLRARDAWRLRGHSGRRATKGQRPTLEFRRPRQTGSGTLLLPRHLHPVARGHTTTRRILRQVLSIRNRVGFDPEDRRSCMAGRPRHRDERRIALLLPAGAQGGLRHAACSRIW
jgi:NADH-quinone oxidoreductase subunit N